MYKIKPKYSEIFLTSLQQRPRIRNSSRLHIARTPNRTLGADPVPANLPQKQLWQQLQPGKISAPGTTTWTPLLHLRRRTQPSQTVLPPHTCRPRVGGDSYELERKASPGTKGQQWTRIERLPTQSWCRHIHEGLCERSTSPVQDTETAPSTTAGSNTATGPGSDAAAGICGQVAAVSENKCAGDVFPKGGHQRAICNRQLL